MLERRAGSYPQITENEVAPDDKLLLWDVTRAMLMNVDMETFRKYCGLFMLQSFGSHRIVVGTAEDWERENPTPQVGDLWIDTTGL